jgi:ATPase family protein associated with various cellular activities (AAA)
MTEATPQETRSPVSTRSTCRVCGQDAARGDLAYGSRAAICRTCVGAGVSATLLGTRAVKDGESLPRAFDTCDLCGEGTPPTGLYQPRPDAGRACCKCLTEACGLLTQTVELSVRRWHRFAAKVDSNANTLLTRHFEGVQRNEVMTTSRTFSTNLRVDLQRALDGLLSKEGIINVGLHARYNHETLSYAALLASRDEAVQIAPLSYEEIDVGGDQPVRCLRSALWLAEEDGLRYAVLLSAAHRYGRPQGWHVEYCVPSGRPGAALVRRHFAVLESAIEASASYRGKVLSLECDPHYDGMGAGTLQVHRLAAVERDSIILPEQTLALLERNVFRFIAQRDRLRAVGMPVKKGLLFYGPPGTGKTHTIRYLARLPEHTTLLVTAEQVAFIAEYMALARLLSPAILVIEDVDLIARHREDLETPQQESLLNRLLNEMDGLREDSEILFILTTNRPEALESALASRPGRIDQAIEFPLPDDNGRARLLALYSCGLELPEALRGSLIPRTAGVSAAFIKELMRRSAQFAFERDPDTRQLSALDLDSALRELLFEGGSLNAKLLGAAAAAP